MPEPKRHLSLYLMKPDTSIENTIRDLSKVSRHELTNRDLDGVLFIKTNQGNVPWWVNFLDPISVDDLRAPSSRTTSAVLALNLKMSDQTLRTVCFAFGYGRFLLDDYRIDRSFGLRVALNAIDPTRLRGFDSRRQEDVVVNSRSQSSVGTDIAAFNLDNFRDILTKVSGSTRETYADNLGGFVRGSDGVSFDVRIDAGDLMDRARQLLEIYEQDIYRESFPFIDHILPVDKATSDRLNQRLSEALLALNNQDSIDFKCLYLAPPEILDFERLEGFTFSTERGQRRAKHTELRLTDYLKTRQNISLERWIDTVKRDSILLYTEGEVEQRLSSVYHSLIAEVEFHQDTYQLVHGTWYEIKHSFVESVHQELSTIPSASIPFPDHIEGEKEKNYNCRAAQHLDALLMDCKNVPIGGGANKIEFCDFAFLDRTLVHAKRRTSSSTLSHLWSQGTVAMAALLGDTQFRESVRREICSLDPTYAHIANEGLTGTDYAVIYLIIGVNVSQDPWESLPFFSQVAFLQAYGMLKSMSVQTMVAGVPSI